ncbi:uncharacterized protein LOC119768044 isoform X1 [Culex quinquefasciatus]|uniref:uncharacterized protein LOC119768044 isoform X1 n=1 Tax=Culex quinquefasciatus TaxID=7176 RepID=UPI0018E2F9CC|nr:uncharacterized protein LOC119768044 isoform X1 [Culex quinquefasciatus]
MAEKNKPQPDNRLRSNRHHRLHPSDGGDLCHGQPRSNNPGHYRKAAGGQRHHHACFGNLVLQSAAWRRGKRCLSDKNRLCAAVEQLHPVWDGAQDCRPAHAARHDRPEVRKTKHVSKSSSRANLLALVTMWRIYFNL